MAINWNTFKENTKTYFSSYIANDSDKAAEHITLQYDIAIIGGGDLLYKNPIAKKNKELLENMIRLSFKFGYQTQTGIYNSLDMIANGLVGYWAGATLAPFNPPPSSIGIVQNVVINPGIAKGIVTPNTTSFDTWLDMFITMARVHLLSISGITVALISSPTGPIPTPFPWQGYK